MSTVCELPFDLPPDPCSDEARKALALVGLDRARMIEVLRPEAEDDHAIEALRLSEDAWKLICTAAPADAAVHWGVQEAGELLDVSVLLARAGRGADAPLPYSELLELLRASFIQDGIGVGIWCAGEGDEASSGRLVLPTERLGDLLDRMRRFALLQRHLGWSVAELDRAIGIFGGGCIDAPFLRRLVRLERLARSVDVRIEEALNWFDTLDTRRWQAGMQPGRPVANPARAAGSGWMYVPAGLRAQLDGFDQPSFYRRIFCTAFDGCRLDPVFELAGDERTLLGEPMTLRALLAPIAGRLGIAEGGVAMLADRLGVSRFSLEGLSALYRHVALARALATPIDELVGFMKLSGLEPFPPGEADAAGALHFVAEFRALRASRFTVAELDLLLHGDDFEGPDSGEGNEAEAAIEKLALALVEVAASHPLLDHLLATGADEPTLRALAEEKLAELVPPHRMVTARAILDLPRDAHARDLPVGASDTVRTWFALFLGGDAERACSALLVEETRIRDEGTRLRYVLGPLLAFLRRNQVGATIHREIASALAVEESYLYLLLEQYVQLHPGTPIIEHFCALIDPRLGISPVAGRWEARAAFRRLQRVVLALKRFGAIEDDFAWLFDEGPRTAPVGTLDLNHFQPQPDRYAGWARLRDAFALRYTDFAGGVFDLQHAAATGRITLDEMADALADRTGWGECDIRATIAGFALGAHDWRDTWASERPYRLLAGVLPILTQAGVTLPTATGWCSPVITAERCCEIRDSIRALHDNLQWPGHGTSPSAGSRPLFGLAACVGPISITEPEPGHFS